MVSFRSLVQEISEYHLFILEFHTYHTKVFYAIYDRVDMRQLLPDLTEQWPSDLIREYKHQPFEIQRPAPDSTQKNEIIHEYFWYKLPSFIPENSIIVAETGTSEFGKLLRERSLLFRLFCLSGVFNMRAPKGVTFLTQILWGSIGYSVGAALGAALAGKDKKRRVFLLVGDGSFQVRAAKKHQNFIFETRFSSYAKRFQVCYDAKPIS